MKQEVKVSIIIPVYNVEQYLEQCLDSIINQTVPEFEVICINDGSTDNSLEILNKYAENDKRFIIVSQENQGQGVARNNALKIAKGEYIVFVDPDDWIELNMLEELLKAFEQTKSEVIHFNHREYNDYSGKFKECNTVKHLINNSNYNLNKIPYYNWKNIKQICLWVVHAPWRRAYKKEFLEKIRALFTPTKLGEDQLFSIIVTLNAEKIYCLDKYFYIHRCRRGSAVNRVSDDGFCVFENIQLLKTYLKEHDLYVELEDEFRQYQFMVLKGHYNFIPTDSREKYKSLCRELLTEEEYKRFKKEIKPKKSFLEHIFSVKNEDIMAIKYKVVTISGIKIRIKPKKKQEIV